MAPDFWPCFLGGCSPEDTTADEQAGFSVSTIGTRLAVGAPFHGGNDKGAVYTYLRDGNDADPWVVLYGTFDFEEFGYSLSGTTSRVVVGAPARSLPLGSGAVHVYVLGAGSCPLVVEQNGTILAPPSADDFGRSVAIDDEFIVVGAKDAAYVYRRGQNGPNPDWVLEDTLLPDSFDPSPDFGLSVAISGEWIVVGAPLDQNANNDQVGAIYFFQREIDCSGGPCIPQWPKRDKEFNPTPQDLDEFGHAVTIEDNWVIAGDPKADIIKNMPPVTFVDQGAVYPFQLSGSDWSWNGQELSGGGSDASDNFGSSVALGRSKVLVGSPNEEDYVDPTKVSGMVYQFNVDTVTQTWCEICTFYGDPPVDGAKLGTSVSLDVSGAVGAPTNGRGKVNVYDPKTGPCQ